MYYTIIGIRRSESNMCVSPRILEGIGESLSRIAVNCAAA